MNDRAIWDLFGDQATFELHLAARYRSVELVGSGKVIVKSADQMAILAEGAQEIKAPDDTDDGPNAPNDSPKRSSNELLAAISGAMLFVIRGCHQK
jgi:hypothetical protein